MISRTCFASRHACAMRSLRLGPIPSTDCSSAVRVSRSEPRLELSYQLLRQNRSDALYQAAAEVSLDTCDRGRRNRLHRACFELQPVIFVPDPPALGDQPFPSGHGGQRPNHRSFPSMPWRFHAQHAEAVFVIVEGDTLNQPGDFLGGSFAFRDGGIHVRGFIFPWALRLCSEVRMGCLCQENAKASCCTKDEGRSFEV